MKIERIDDKTVKCYISNEELNEYEITYKDFVLRNDKAREVMEDIIDLAEEEVGYQPPRFAFDLQIMMMPEEGMILTLSEKEPGEAKSGESLLECLKEMKQILQEKRELLGIQSTQKNELPETADAKAEEVTQQAKEKDPVTYAVFAFDDIRSICEYAAILPSNLRVKSILYQLGDVFYLYLDKGTASYERYSRTCIRALEYGRLYAADERKIVYLEEHANCILASHALKKLRIG